ncbi:dihydrofolate reductase family protein [Arthrobacter sp. Sa2CUA1]|uniref:Dihydrofolate reductase family protein n=1 Tax=Arthrobacter gallicola TaxID=2762225 RepID=A0ABR8UME1_9MICC|nr:dihydrofolate reductase family protein [Arthrobacter gallicola]MBD7993719.1 dihydrofolate reductase family protein [Arthrobacter gallicola]
MKAANRRVVANIAISLDGFYQGPGGEADMGWLMPYAVTDTSRDHLTALWAPATTALLGRVNAVGFFGYWPAVADDADADPRDRAYGKWMRDTEKVVLSSTLAHAPWSRARIFNEPAEHVVDRLKEEAGGDIVVFSSASVIKALLAAHRVDRLSFTMFPEILGGGKRLFENGLPASKWTLASSATGDHGVVSLTYDRV